MRTGRKFTPEDIEGGILEDILIESDYDVLRVVSVTFFHLRTCMFLYLDLLRFRTCYLSRSIVFIISLVFNLQKKDLQAERRKVLSDEAKRLFRKEPGLLKAAEEEFKSKFAKFRVTNFIYIVELVFLPSFDH